MPLLFLTNCKDGLDIERLKPVFPYVFLFIYCTSGGVIFYLLDTHMEMTYDHRAIDRSKCIGGHDDISGALYYTLAACSTIGFGVIYPCTDVARWVAVVYSLIGIPLLLTVLNDIGVRTTDALVAFEKWRKRRQKRNQHLFSMNGSTAISSKKKGAKQDTTVDRGHEFRIGLLGGGTVRHHTVDVESIHGGDMTESLVGADEDNPDVPVWISLFLTISCILLCALFYWHVEDYGIAESLYFSFQTFLCGDFAATNFVVAVPVYGIILFGFSMLSTTIHVIQNNIENLVRRLKENVAKEIEELQRKIDSGEIDPTALGKSPQQMVNDIIKKQGGGVFAKQLISKSAVTDIVEHCESKIEQAQIQQEVKRLEHELHDVDAKMFTSSEVQATTTMVNTEAQTEDPHITDRLTQTPVRISVNKLSQATPKGHDVAVQFWPYRNFVQCQTEVDAKNQETETEKQHTMGIDFGAQILCMQRHVGIQYPSSKYRQAGSKSSTTTSGTFNEAEEVVF